MQLGKPPSQFAIGDLSGDGKLDVAVANELPNNVLGLVDMTSLCVVPNVRGKTLPSARRAIARTHCRIGKIRRAYSKIVKKARVISEKPKPGTQLPSRARVNLLVSRGPLPGGSYFPGARLHTAVLRDSILNPEHGTVEAWYRQTSNPVPFKHNPHRIFGGPTA
jgi:hypothetical protein